jgi:hypothetical protein
MGIPAYRIHHISRVCTGRMNNQRISDSRKTISPKAFHDEIEFPSDQTKKQFIDRLISEAVTQLSMRVWKREDPKIVDDIPPDSYLENGKRELYGFLM